MKKIILGLVTALLMSGFALFGGVPSATAAANCGGPDLPRCHSVPAPDPTVDATNSVKAGKSFKITASDKVKGDFVVKIVRDKDGTVVFRDSDGDTKSITSKVNGINRPGDYTIIVNFNPTNPLYQNSSTSQSLTVR